MKCKMRPLFYNQVVIIIVVILHSAASQFLDQLKKQIQFVEDESSFASAFKDFNIIKEDDLIDILPTRLANIGPAFIVRDTVSALLAKDEGSRAGSWTMAIVGVLAFITQQLAMQLKEVTDDPTGLNFLQTTSKILGVGVGVVALSNDLNNVITSSRCLSESENVTTTRRDSRWSILGSSPSPSPSSSWSISTERAGDCGRFVLANYFANLLALGADIFAILVPPAGPFAAMFAIFKTIATTYFELWSWDAFE